MDNAATQAVPLDIDGPLSTSVHADNAAASVLPQAVPLDVGGPPSQY